ncbi:hypothetical protein STSP2_02439 [Anaerohalosphaera lusitana]|uniref:Polymerase/histidinol phosphatase N-terminal domain-containing protein n=1 Tax=Anaerohalosphaera lusitana TaxID=1936003 RepID=A0A1U9NNQ7_9BACT|nr:hypothetical protein [Anaerohalosphaera lusitana]AQT69250.1 hypothetical protein STSP2_02439 [Anaerohalosphaera lusitana]
MKMFRDLEAKLDSFEKSERVNAINALIQGTGDAGIKMPEPKPTVNLHCHTFFSYNCYDYSPSKLAWLARQKGLTAAGIVDFDVLDGVDEFHRACFMLGLKGFAGLETRVFVPEFSDKVINSPGEPGIAYHMGVGFPTGDVDTECAVFLDKLRTIARERNESLIGRVNDYLSPVTLDYEADVLSLTPNGNATERHICLAYAKKAEEVFGNGEELADFWAEKLQMDRKELDLPDGVGLQGAIRAKTMKKGGVGYVQPDGGSYPTLRETNRFILDAGGIPTMTWLNGLTDGEQLIEEMLDVYMAAGVAAINIIPDRNFTPGVVDEKLEKLHEVIGLAKKKGLPVFVGTEMNSPGQKFCDDFESDELAPFEDTFMQGAYIGYAHSVLQRYLGVGYLSEWADENFDSVFDKNAFFAEVGRKLPVERQPRLTDLSGNDFEPGDIMNLAE